MLSLVIVLTGEGGLTPRSYVYMFYILIVAAFAAIRLPAVGDSIPDANMQNSRRFLEHARIERFLES